MERDSSVSGIVTAFIGISTHALTWSATIAAAHECAEQADFNSRAHVERDTRGGRKQYIVDISTHALTWSAT